MEKERYKTHYERYCENEKSKNFCRWIIFAAIVVPPLFAALMQVLTKK